jgi:hypothetical protein
VVVIPPVVTAPIIPPTVIAPPVNPAPIRGPSGPTIVGMLPATLVAVAPRAPNVAVIGPGVRMPAAELQATQAEVVAPAIVEERPAAPAAPAPRRRPVLPARQDRN